MSNYRTPHWVMMLRVLRPTWGLILILVLLMGWPIGLPLLIVAAVVFGMMMVIGGIVKFFGWVQFGDDPDYQRARASGWHPYFDLLPPGINNDSLAVRIGGIPEPQTEFVPPEDWLRQCQRCGARNQSCSPECWHCKATFIEPNTVVDDTLPRNMDCPCCGKFIVEKRYGDFDRGVVCPFCRENVITAPDQQIHPTPQSPQVRTFNCTSCGKSLRELVPGTWETGVTCCYCGALNMNRYTLPLNPSCN
jgi:hypothetical protein